MSDQDPLDTAGRAPSSPHARPSDQDDRSEQLDDDKLGGDYPPDAPVGSDEYGVTPGEQLFPEPIEERVKRERPEAEVAGEPDGVGRLVEPDEGVRRDEEKSMVASEVEGVAPHDRPVGDVGTDDVTTRGTVVDRSGDVAAEESAVHERREP